MLDAQKFFREPLVSLDGKYSRVLTPQAEVGKEKIGVSDFLLERAEEYFERFENYGIYHTLKAAIDKLNCPIKGVAIDIGSGFGNTVIPLLKNFPDLAVVATDISPDLLAILMRQADIAEVAGRCCGVAMDAHGDYLEDETVDVAFGNAILHHLIDPQLVIHHVLRALKPGGNAIFCEPFQAGHAVIAMAYNSILREAEYRNQSGPGFQFLHNINMDIYVRSHRRFYADCGMTWEQLDDKWLFTRSHFERIAENLKCSKVEVWPQYLNHEYVSEHTRVTLRQYGGLPLESLPDWAWDTLRRYDEDFLTPELKREFILEGVIAITR